MFVLIWPSNVVVKAVVIVIIKLDERTIFYDCSVIFVVRLLFLTLDLYLS